MSKDKSWFKMQVTPVAFGTGALASIDIYDEIGVWGITAADFKNELDNHKACDELEINIHSPGGSIVDGLAIYNLIKNDSRPSVARIDGQAASMATVIALSADKVTMPENAFFMIHKPQGGQFGEADDLRDMADVMDKMEARILSIYAAKTGQSEEFLAKMMAQETWMTGAEALELGFVDELTGALEMAALSSKVDAMAGALERAGIAAPVMTAEEPAEPIAEESETVEEAEAATDEEPAAVEEEVPEGKGGFIERISGMLGGKPKGGTEARAQLATLRGEYDTLSAKLERRDAALVAAKAEASELSAKLKVMRAERQTVIDMVAESGFAPESAASLPNPDAGDAGGPSASIREQFNAITNKAERKAFYEKHKSELLHS